MIPSTDNLAWFAGLFEGEGCIVTPGRDAFRLDTASTDRDVLEQACLFVGLGYINGPYDRGPGRKPMYYHRVTGDDAYALLVMMWPWLRSRRRAKAVEVIQDYVSRPLTGSRALSCRNGHEYTEDNVYWHDNKRNCRACRTKVQRERRATQKKVTSLGSA